MSNLLKTVFLQKDVIECEKNSVPLASKCVSNATISSLQYALFLEDDQFIAFDALRLIAELIIQNDKPVGLYYICDSYYNNRKFFPPSHIENTDYINSMLKYYFFLINYLYYYSDILFIFIYFIK